MNGGDGDTIRCEPLDDCYLCGARGEELYRALRDQLYGAPGDWNLWRCSAQDCGLLWLNPMPGADDLHLAYADYYTHDPAAVASRALGAARRRGNAYFLYIRDRAPGRLLEIGCGDGSRLQAFEALGWQVTGQETDERAARIAAGKTAGAVLQGPLEQQALPERHFDAIVMNHVLEHVPNPRELLQRCRRLLAPGGVLSLVTPNARSLGHALFRSNWRGLEPPRHVYIYTPGALQRLAASAGFRDYSVSTRSINAAGTVAQGSLGLWRQSRGAAPLPPLLTRLLGHLLRVAEYGWRLFDRGAGAECVLLAARTAGDD